MNDDLKKIKKKYGEDMAKLCREMFPLLLQTEGLLPSILFEHFNPSRELYNDIIDTDHQEWFRNFVYSNSGLAEETYNENYTNKTPKELMSDAGYILYECKTVEDVKQFERYYALGEKLCTFKDIEDRLARCHVFFAVKKDVDNIRRINFLKPERQDLYGTSVISIQFDKNISNSLSIKNRYNHHVDDPDATFDNNLDNIIPGLIDSFEKEYGLREKYRLNGSVMSDYVKANDGKYYKYNCVGGKDIYFCSDNIVIDHGEVKRIPREKFILIDSYLLDLRSGNIWSYDDKDIDPFVDSIKDIEKIEITKEDKNKKIVLSVKNKEAIEITIDSGNRMIGLKDNNIEILPDGYLGFNEYLKSFEAKNVKEIGNDVLVRNCYLTKLDVSSVEKIGDYFLYQNFYLENFDMPNLKEMGSRVLYTNNVIKRFVAPNLEIVGQSCLPQIVDYDEFYAPYLKVNNPDSFQSRIREFFGAEYYENQGIGVRRR